MLYPNESHFIVLTDLVRVDRGGGRHGGGVISTQLEAVAAHSLYEVVVEGSQCRAILKHKVAVLPVGEVVVTQVGSVNIWIHVCL